MADTKSKISFTVAALKAVECPPSGRADRGGRVYRYDSRVPGLAFCATEGGARSFLLCRRVNGQYQRIRIGDEKEFTIDQARRRAGELNSEISKGDDPLATRRAAREAAGTVAATVADLWNAYRNEYLAGHAKPNTIKEYDRMYNVHLATWKGRSLAEITTEECEVLKIHVGAKGHHMANRVLQLVSAMFRRCGKKFGLPKKWSPTADVQSYAEKARDRVLSPEELAKVLASIDADEDATARDYFRMLVYTGVRKTNVAQMRWDDVSDQRGTWKIPGETTKNGDPLVVTLVPDAMTIINRRAETNPADSPFVFPACRPTQDQIDRARAFRAEGRTTRAIAGELNLSQSSIMRMIDPTYAAKDFAPYGGSQKGWARILKRAKITARTTIHDIRRTYCTNLIEAGVPLPMVSAAMGHRSMATTQRHYSFARQDKVAEAVKMGVAAMLAGAQAAQTAADEKAKKKAG